MDEEQIHIQPCKLSRVGNGRTGARKIGQFPEDDEDGKLKRSNLGTGSGAIVVGGGDLNRLRGLQHSSRIIRVSRATGGKDRHSKVWTSKGPRDRRVRLSVTTAIQFYDLQDRLGYDQPSKAVEWLIKAAADAIEELPSLNGTFPATPKQLSDETRIDSVDVELEDQDLNINQNQNQNQHFSLSKSACSSNSDTSKGSGLSLSRSGARVKARERARKRTAKEKDRERSEYHHQNANPISQNSSFTELLTCGFSSLSSSNNNGAGCEANLIHNKAAVTRQWPLTPMDYFSTGLLGQSSSRTAHHSTGFPGQMQLGNSIPHFSFSGENHQQEQSQPFSFPSDHLIPAATQQGPSGDYNLNFTISSSLAGFNRGTLQSNSSSPNSLFPHLQQRFSSSSPIDAPSNVPFFMGATAAPQPHPMDHHHHLQFQPGLHLYGGNGSSRHSDHKTKGKN